MLGLSSPHFCAAHSRMTLDTNAPSPLFKNVWCVRETEILVEQQPPQGSSSVTMLVN